MGKRVEILNVPFDLVTLDEAADRVFRMFDMESQSMVCTPNPEIVVDAQHDKELMGILKESDLVVMDGIGVVWAARRKGLSAKGRVTGYDLVQKIFFKMKDTPKTAYFFGGKPKVAEAAAKKMSKKYPGLKIVGVHDGYFTPAEEIKIILDIKRLSPDLLLVGLGSPKQEKWIYTNMRLMGAKVSIGVGGCFDVMAGNVKRAPIVFRKMGLEWFFRLLSQPSRFWRMMKLPKFVFMVLAEKK